MTHDELIRLTKATLEPYAGHPLTDAEAEECIQNMTAILQLLNDLQTPATSNATEEAGGGRAGEPPYKKSA